MKIVSDSTGENDFELELEVEVEAELAMAESSRPEDTAGRPAPEWLFDPVDVQREEIELRSLLRAVEEVAGDSGTGEGT
jgi:hypothetical protein